MPGAWTEWLAARPAVETASAALLVVGFAAAAFLVARRWLVALLAGAIRRTAFRWDDALLEHGVLGRAAALAPLLVVYYGVAVVPHLAPSAVAAVLRLAFAGMVVAGLLALFRLLDAANDVYQSYPLARGRPIKGYLQLVKIFLAVVGALGVVALLLDRSPVVLLTGVGALTAVLLLIFRDTILSLVASVQIASNDMVRIGDWIEMPKYGADGDVIDIALHTVKVQNWDKTITTIPTYKLIEDSFKNWRGMQEAVDGASNAPSTST